MNEPTAFVYETSYKTISTSNPKIVTFNGIKCLDGGTIKQGKKFVNFAVRLDDKPELVAALDAYQADWDRYNRWFAEQVEVVKATITIDTPANFTKAENDDFSWSTFDGTSGQCLTEKSTNKQIYQMRYSNGYKNGTTELTEETKVKVKLFWAALDAFRNDAKAAAAAAKKAWAESPEGKAEMEEWDRYEAFKRKMEAPDSDY